MDLSQGGIRRTRHIVWTNGLCPDRVQEPRQLESRFRKLRGRDRFSVLQLRRIQLGASP